MLTVRTTIALFACAAALAGGCGDDSGGTDAAPPDAGISVDVGLDASIDSGLDDAADLGLEIDAAVAVDLPVVEADASPDLAADQTADAPRPGILSVPADDLDVMARELTLDGGVRAYLAVPNRVGTFAGLVLVPDAHGLDEHLRDVARRFAKSGCVALVPDLGAQPEAALLAGLDAALAALASQPQLGPNRTGAAGFGEGGARALRFAVSNPKVRAVVAYYPPPAAAEALMGIGASVLAQYGEKDETVTAGSAALEAAVKAAGKTFEKRVYPAGSGFNDDTGPGYDEAAAVAAWPYTLGWMEVYLN